MPQIDRYRQRAVPIEFNYNEQFQDPALEERLRLVLISNGDASLLINGKTWAVSAPMVLCLSVNDEVKILNKHRFAAKSFIFFPGFLNSNFNFETLKANSFPNLQERHDSILLRSFFNHNDRFPGLLNIPSSMFLRISEWFAVIGTETSAQSDGMWTCRIRRYLLQTLYLLEDLYVELAKKKFDQPLPTGDEYVKITLEYIHTNYHQDISLDTLCRVTNINRTSLTKRFKEKTGHTMIDYLIKHRVKIACEALAHTNLRLNEIAEACGFMNTTYFNKQFSKRVGVTPSAYREKTRGKFKKKE